MATLNIAGYRAALKQLYPKEKIENLTFKNNPAYAMMPKDPDAGGENWKVPVHYEDIAGQAANFQKAQANKNISRKVAFLLTPVRDYALASIDGLVWRSSLGNRKAFLAANKSELDSAFNSMRRSAGISVYRSGTGNIGRINATVAGTTLTLATLRDINNFGRGFKIAFSATDGGTLRDGGKTLTITAINRSAGSMTVNADLSTIAGLTANDFIYRDGDAADGGANLKVSGFDSWLPVTAPTAGDNHFGVDRSVDVVRLAGNRIDASGLSVEDAFIRAITEVAEQGGSPDHIFCPYNTWERLGKELGGRKEYTDTESAGFYFRGIKMYSPEGEVAIYADRNCPSGRAYALTMNTWTWYSVGESIGILDLDGNGTFFREATDDAYELRVGGYPQVGCCAPGNNAVLYNMPT
jgi:hypothetical protein